MDKVHVLNLYWFQFIIGNHCIIAYPLSGMITVPVSAGAYQSVVASIQQGGGITFHSPEGLSGGSNGGIQLISTPLQLANGQIIAKVEQAADPDATSRQSIQNLVTKVMGQQSIHR